MNRVREILNEEGPMLSGELASIIEKKYNIGNDAARKAISRATKPVQKLKIFPFNKNQVFCYLQSQYNSSAYRNRLYDALVKESSAVSSILKALENSYYIMQKDMLPIYSASPVQNTIGHRLFDDTIASLINQGIIEEIDDYYSVSEEYAGERYNLSYSRGNEQVYRTVVEDFVKWASKLNLVAFDSSRSFPENAIFAHFKWFATVPSYISPLFDIKAKRPGFVVVDVLLKDNASIDDVAYIVKKVGVIRCFANVPYFAPILLVTSISREALDYLKKNQIIIGILSNLYDRKYVETLRDVLFVYRNAASVIKISPNKIDKLLGDIKKSEGRFNNVKGFLFECMVGHLFYSIGCRDYQLNIHLPKINDRKYEIDVLVERDRRIIVIECKATRSALDKEYVEKWLGERIPAILGYIHGRYSKKDIEFYLWSLGGFDEEAKTLLENHSPKKSKYTMVFFDKERILKFAKQHGCDEFCKRIDEHFTRAD